MDVAERKFKEQRGESEGGDGLEIRPERRLADDGKRSSGRWTLYNCVASRREVLKRSKGRGSGEGRVPDSTAGEAVG